MRARFASPAWTLLLLAAVAMTARDAAAWDHVLAFGDSDFLRNEVPPPNSGFVAVADGGWYHCLGLKTDGSVAAWGTNPYGQCDVPAPNADFVAIACGANHSLGLKLDGSIVAWGLNSSTQCNVPPPNSDFVAMAAGFTHTLGLKGDGSIVAWGGNIYGQCSVPAPNADFIAIACGGDHSIGLKADSSVVAWGRNLHGQCNVPAPNAEFVAISAGIQHSIGLKADGSIVAWGDNTYHQRNVPAPNTGFVAIDAGAYHNLALKADSSIVAWEWNAHGECSPPSPNAGFTEVSGGFWHSCALRHATTVRVPLDAASIAGAIDLAGTGDTVLVATGVYQEHGLVMKSGTTLRGESGQADGVIIDGGSLGRVMNAFGLADGRIEGITITGGLARWGAGMVITGSDGLTLSNVVFHDNVVYDPAYSQGGALDIEGGSPTLRNVTIAHNTGLVGGGVSIFGGSPSFENCILAFNDGASVYVYPHASGCPQFGCTDIYGNTGGDWIGCFATQVVADGNLAADPLFCPPDSGAYALDGSSPCLPGHSGCVDLIGAMGLGCGATDAAVPAWRETVLAQNEPNPFSTATTIRFSLPRSVHVRLVVFDVAGRVVAVPHDGELPAGPHTVRWLGRNAAGHRVAAGAYFYRLEAGALRSTRRLVVVR